MSDRELITGLEEAVVAAPGNIALRLHLVEHLIANGRPAEALAHSEAILRAQPDSVRAAEMAARSAEASADMRASSFARLARALQIAVTSVPAQPAQEAAEIPPSPAPVPTHVAPFPVPELPGAADSPLPLDEEPAAPEQDVPEAMPTGETTAVAQETQSDASGTREDPAPEPVHEFTIDSQSIQRPTIALRNIIGVDDVKQRIQSVVLDPIRSRNGNGARSVPRQGGYLMFGPPGCGKGFFARVVAGEIGAGYLPIQLGRALEWPGDPRQNIHRIFEAAREAAPCVLFLDEVDQAGRHVDAPDDAVDRGIVSRLVTELDTAAANSGVYVFAGAVAPWDVDMALRSDGRLDRTLLVLPPDEAAREAILRFHLKSTRLAGVDVGWIVQRTQHFSGDDLLLLCETAAGLAEADALGTRPAIGPGHITRALRDVRPTAPAWFSSVLDHAFSSNQGGIYDEALAYVDQHQLV